MFLRLSRSSASGLVAEQSADGVTWAPIGSVVVPFGLGDVLAGLAVTSHDVTRLNIAMFDHVAVTPCLTTQNLLQEGDFEGYEPPALGMPGWVSDDGLRQVPAKSETHQPRSGRMNGACWTPLYLDCGIYQEVIAPQTAMYPSPSTRRPIARVVSLRPTSMASRRLRRTWRCAHSATTPSTGWCSRRMLEMSFAPGCTRPQRPATW